MLNIWIPLTTQTLSNQGLSDCSIINNGTTINSQGKIGSCYSFDGNDDFISIDCPDLYRTFSGGSQPFSIAFWIYHADSTRGVIFGDFGLSGSINFNIELTANHQIRYYWNGGPDKTFTSTTVEINTWVHIVLTYDGSKICIYKNGSLQTDTYASSLIKLTKTSGLFYLGRDARTGATALNGRINDFRIYSHCLSPIECKKISSALILHYPLSSGGAENLLSSDLNNISKWGVPSGSTKVQAEEDGFNCIKVYSTNNTGMNLYRGMTLEANTEYTYSFDIKSSISRPFSFSSVGHYQVRNSSISGDTGLHQDTNRIFSPTTLTAGEWTRCSVTFTTLSECQAFCPYIWYLGSSGESGCVFVKNFKLEKGDHATPWVPNSSDSAYSAMGYDDGIEYDVSGYGNNATKVGTIAASGDTPRYSTSSSFDGSSYIINNTSTIHLSNEFTIAWWGKINTWLKKWEGMFILQNTTALNGANGTFSISNALHGSNADKMSLTIRQGGTTYPFDHYNWTYTIDEWAHYALAYNKGTIIMYQNGNSVYTSTIEDTSSTDYYYAIGHRLYKSDCQISDFRVYNTALSQEDIQSIYNTPLTLSNNGTLLTQGELSEV